MPFYWANDKITLISAGLPRLSNARKQAISNIEITRNRSERSAMERYKSYSSFIKEYFGEKMYKICLDGGFTCPNRDGSLALGGCTFCSERGSGDYAEQASLSIGDQISLGKRQTSGKYRGNHYIAYFQAFTSTYAPTDRLRALYEEALARDEIAGLAIGTRPDCLSEETLDLLQELNRTKPVFLEMGLQTCHDQTAQRLNRCYPSSLFADSCRRLHNRGIRCCAHVILGLPGESRQMQYETIDFLNHLPVSGIKISMLYVLKGTTLGQSYQDKPFPLYSLEEYVDVVIGCLERLRPDIVVERMTGDGPVDLLLAPGWIPQKGRVLNLIHHEMKVRDTYQGRYYEET